MTLSYYCKHCNRHFYKLVPQCEINKDEAYCRACGRIARLDREDYIDTVLKNLEGLKDDVHGLTVDMREVRSGLGEAVGEAVWRA